jgi:hypothetical protein
MSSSRSIRSGARARISHAVMRIWSAFDFIPKAIASMVGLVAVSRG